MHHNEAQQKLAVALAAYEASKKSGCGDNWIDAVTG
jgi:hypothetical protein